MLKFKITWANNTNKIVFTDIFEALNVQTALTEAYPYIIGASYTGLSYDEMLLNIEKCNCSIKIEQI